MTIHHFDHGNDFRVRGRLQASLQAKDPGDAVILGLDKKIPYDFVRDKGYTYGLHFDPNVFPTDPAGCLSYMQGCSCKRPIVNNSGVFDSSDWSMDDMFFEGVRYITMDFHGNEISELDPMDLTKDINGNDTTDELSVMNVMLEIPRRYVKRFAGGIVHSSYENEGSPDAFIRGSHTYKYLDIGVYPMSKVEYTDGSGQRSIGTSNSQLKPCSNIAGATLRAMAQATDSELEWHVWNWHEYQLWKDMVLFATKSFNSQATVGKGQCNAGNSPEYWSVNGGVDHVVDKAGPWYGDLTATNKPVKALIENPWGELWQLVDDCLLTNLRTDDTDPENPLYYQDIYAGQNDNAHIDDLTTSKSLIASIPVPSNRISSGGWVYSQAIDTTQLGWGLPSGMTGDTSTGLCDGHYMQADAQKAVRVGGSSFDGLAAGLSALALDNGLSRSLWSCGARLAFVHD